MTLRYSCFISYRHTQADITHKLVSSLEIELRRWLDLDIYIDDKKLVGGDFYNNEIAKAICESVCLIVVYTPTYFSKQNAYCSCEYKAMEMLERQRLEKLGLPKNMEHGMIIPIIYRGNKIFPKEIIRERQCYFFEEYQISGRDNLKNPQYAKVIEEIGEYIQKRCGELKTIEDDLCSCCDTFTIPKPDEISDWIETMLPPRPEFPIKY